MLDRASSYNQRSAMIASVAESSGIRIDTLQPEEQRTEGRVSWIPIVCTGEGGVDSLMSWIETLEKEWPDIVVQSLSIDTGSADGLVRLGVVFRWYVLAPQAG